MGRILDWTLAQLIAVYRELVLIQYEDDAAANGVPRFRIREACRGPGAKGMTDKQKELVRDHLFNGH